MKIAIEGCAHGELDKIYEVIGHLEEQNKIKVDLLIICGDFQSVRNKTDLMCMSVPQKYRKLNTFYKYYSGEKIAPVLTIFVGGNHEASNYLTELHYGGWVCPNIYYLGRAGVVQFGGVRIAGLSGIYKGNDYWKGHYEIPPFNNNTVRSVYHVRKLEVFKLSQIQEPVDIMLSHDWPSGVYNFGNVGNLLKRKPFFKEEIDKGILGSSAGEELLHKLRPKYWFAAHLHCKFAALIPHEDGSTTKFLALDKCLPRRKFLQVIDVKAKNDHPLQLSYDLEWLAILAKTNHLLNTTSSICVLPNKDNFKDSDDSESKDRSEYGACEKDKEEIARLLIASEIKTSESESVFPAYLIPTDFERGPPAAYTPNSVNVLLEARTNPQTTKLCKTLNITDPTAKLMLEKSRVCGIFDLSGVIALDSDLETSKNPDEIDLGSDADDTKEDDNKEDNDGSSKKNSRDESFVPLNDAAKKYKPNTMDENGLPLFVIDTKPSLTSTPVMRRSLVLPPPISPLGTVLFEGQETPNTSRRSSQMENSSIPSAEKPDKTTGPVALKRRNFAMYKDNDNDDIT